jgi:arylformamidase
MKIIDISLPITSSMPVYPGTSPTSIESVVSASGTNVLSDLHMTSHTGTHIDAPSHSIQDGKTVDALDLSIFYGPCRVLEFTSSTQAISKEDLLTHGVKRSERILLKTANSLRGFDTFYPDYTYLTSGAATYLAQTEVLLVGIDSLSIKQKGSTDNTAHTALLAKDIPIVEGLDLSKVDPGDYMLCVFPLAVRGIDGSPARAVLVTN